MKLYEIPMAIEEVIERGFSIDEETGEVFDESDLDSLDAAFDEKMEATACYVKNIVAEAAAMKEEAASLNARAKSRLSRADALKDYMSKCMESAGKKSVETVRCKLTSRAVSRVDVFDEEELPAVFKRSKLSWSPDKKAIAEQLRDGIDVPGARLLQSRSLTIK